MSDLFQEPVPDEYIQAVTTIMLRANWHTYQVLTKRAERLHERRIDLAGIDWVIVGGESGPGARPMRQAWVESLLEQCARSGAPGRTYDDMPPRTAQLIPSRSERASMETAFPPLDNRWPTNPLVHLRSLPRDRR